MFRILADLLRLRTGPQELPSSWPFTVAAFAALLVLGVLTGEWLEGEDNAARNLLSMLVQVLAVAALLRWRRCPERLPQTLLALALTSLVLGSIAFAVLTQVDGSGDQPAMALLWFAVFGWSLAVDANIYRHALSLRLPQGMLVAVAILAATYVIMQLAFGG